MSEQSTCKYIFCENLNTLLYSVQQSITNQQKFEDTQTLFNYLLIVDYNWREKHLELKETVKQKLKEFIRLDFLTKEQKQYYVSTYRAFGFESFCIGRTQRGSLCSRKVNKDNSRCFLHEKMYQKRLSDVDSVIGVIDVSKIVLDYI